MLGDNLKVNAKLEQSVAVMQLRQKKKKSYDSNVLITFITI